ncbi:MAG: hypothetical protein AAFP84_21390 [Actinomycetota bacterium]
MTADDPGDYIAPENKARAALEEFRFLAEVGIDVDRERIGLAT